MWTQALWSGFHTDVLLPSQRQKPRANSSPQKDRRWIHNEKLSPLASMVVSRRIVEISSRIMQVRGLGKTIPWATSPSVETPCQPRAEIPRGGSGRAPPPLPSPLPRSRPAAPPRFPCAGGRGHPLGAGAGSAPRPPPSAQPAPTAGPQGWQQPLRGQGQSPRGSSFPKAGGHRPGSGSGEQGAGRGAMRAPGRARSSGGDAPAERSGGRSAQLGALCTCGRDRRPPPPPPPASLYLKGRRCRSGRAWERSGRRSERRRSAADPPPKVSRPPVAPPRRRAAGAVGRGAQAGQAGGGRGCPRPTGAGPGRGSPSLCGAARPSRARAGGGGSGLRSPLRGPRGHAALGPGAALEPRAGGGGAALAPPGPALRLRGQAGERTASGTTSANCKAKGKKKNNKRKEARSWDVFEAQYHARHPSRSETLHASESHHSDRREAGCGRCALALRALESPWLSGWKMIPATGPCCWWWTAEWLEDALLEDYTWRKAISQGESWLVKLSDLLPTGEVASMAPSPRRSSRKDANALPSMSSTFWAIMILASLLIAYCSKYMFVLVLLLGINLRPSHLR